MNFRAFLTGSHAYGIPKSGSDVDLVVSMDPGEIEVLAKLADKDQRHTDMDYKECGAISLRFGNLNLICVFDDAAYRVWREGTTRLKSRKRKLKMSIPREYACEFFDRLRKAAGPGK